MPHAARVRTPIPQVEITPGHASDATKCAWGALTVDLLLSPEIFLWPTTNHLIRPSYHASSRPSSTPTQAPCADTIARSWATSISSSPGSHAALAPSPAGATSSSNSPTVGGKIIEVTLFFKALKSKRRLANLISVNLNLARLMRSRPWDPFAEIDELSGFDILRWRRPLPRGRLPRPTQAKEAETSQKKDQRRPPETGEEAPDRPLLHNSGCATTTCATTRSPSTGPAAATSTTCTR